MNVHVPIFYYEYQNIMSILAISLKFCIGFARVYCCPFDSDRPHLLDAKSFSQLCAEAGLADRNDADDVCNSWQQTQLKVWRLLSPNPVTQLNEFPSVRASVQVIPHPSKLSYLHIKIKMFRYDRILLCQKEIMSLCDVPLSRNFASYDITIAARTLLGSWHDWG